eukprot:6190492-Pleurochrysis_carterae.AAC.2
MARARTVFVHHLAILATEIASRARRCCSERIPTARGRCAQSPSISGLDFVTLRQPSSCQRLVRSHQHCVFSV